MKNILLLSLIFFAFSCGSKNNNQINSGAQEAPPKTEAVEIPPEPSKKNVNFEGLYDIRDQLSDECPKRINIIRECNGYVLLSNTSKNENFCNVNANTEQVRYKDNKKVVVTQEDNQLKAVVTLGKNTYTNLLILDEDNFLTKTTDYKGRNTVVCYYEKRLN